MNNFFRALIAGYGAKKLGGGCFGTIIVFILIWVALGQCSFKTIDPSVNQQEKPTSRQASVQMFARPPVEGAMIFSSDHSPRVGCEVNQIVWINFEELQILHKTEPCRALFYY
jgi:hypothetical protein